MSSAVRKTVYFVRHGQSVDNAAPVFQSVTSPLSEKGTAQAKSIAERLSSVSFDALIASPVQRARQTAEFIAKSTGKEIELCDLFVERIKPKEIDGKPYTDEAARNIWREWDKSLYAPGHRVSDSENFSDLVTRADKALAYLQARPEPTLAVITHGYFLGTIVARVLLGDDLTGAALKHFQTHSSIENTAVTVLHLRDDFEQDFEWRLWTLNDHSHFAE